MKTLSIITINKNNSAGLEKTIQSVICQSSSDFEYIIIDGASNDLSVEIIKKYENRINYWICEEDTGIYNAMNKGIKNAHGQYCLFLNSGDILLKPDTLNNVLIEISENPSDIYYSDYFLQDYNVKALPDNLKLSYLLFDHLNHQNTFIKRSLFIDHNYYNENYNICSDHEFFINEIFYFNTNYFHLTELISLFDFNGYSYNNYDKLLKEDEAIFKNIFKNNLNFINSFRKFYIINYKYKIKISNEASEYINKIFSILDNNLNNNLELFIPELKFNISKLKKNNPVLIKKVFRNIIKLFIPVKLRVYLKNIYNKNKKIQKKISIPKISIIIPVYNADKFICRCIDSVLSQTFTDFECILVDDCSTDKSYILCEEYAKKDKRILLIHKKKNEGVSIARKTGYNNSCGKYILNIDSDDYIESNMIENMYLKISDENLDFIYCDFYYHNELNEVKHIILNKYHDDFIDNIKLFVISLDSKSYLWNKLVKRTIYDKLMFDKHGCWEDKLLTTQILYYSEKIGYLGEPLYHYNNNPTSLINNKKNESKKYNEMINNFNKLLLFIKYNYDKNLDALNPEMDIMKKWLNKRNPLAFKNIVKRIVPSLFWNYLRKHFKKEKKILLFYIVYN